MWIREGQDSWGVDKYIKDGMVYKMMIEIFMWSNMFVLAYLLREVLSNRNTMQTTYVLLIFLIAKLNKSKGTGEIILIFYLTKYIQCVIILICNHIQIIGIILYYFFSY